VPKVLIPTDDQSCTTSGLADGYRSLGWEVATGALNFKLRAAHYDAVHYQWPEEYTGWQRPPKEHQIAEIEDCVKWWASRAASIFTVHNLYPHAGVGNPAFHDLYSCFYRHCHVISHFSHTSHRLVLEEFPDACKSRHVVHYPESHEVMLVRQRQRGSRRAEMNIRDDEFVILMLGQLRSWEEIELIMRAYDLAKIPKKRLLMAGKTIVCAETWQTRLRLRGWDWWLKRRGAVVDTTWVPEDELSRFLDSSDVSIVPRLAGLNSAIIFSAMTFGRMIIAPNCGAYPEHLAGTRNLLYQPGDATSFASKLEEAAALGTDDIGRENAVVASKWSPQERCRVCLEAAANLHLFSKDRTEASTPDCAQA
jgi:glycosyltransferase involved in cell wall biosynthesis